MSSHNNALVAAILVVLTVCPSYAAEKVAPVVTPKLPYVQDLPGWITVYWTHSGTDVESFLIQREKPDYTWRFEIADGQLDDKGLVADTIYRYRACAVYRDATRCSEWLALRTAKEEPAPVPQQMPPPEFVGRGEAYHEPSRIWIRWRRTTDRKYDRVIVRWYREGSGLSSQVDVDSSAPEGSYEVLTQIPGTYVFSLKACTLNIVGVAKCGDWSVPLKVATATQGVARVDCMPGTLKTGSPSFSVGGRAEYQFENPIPTYNTPAGICRGPDRKVVVAGYLVHGIWNPAAQPGAWDNTGANTTESITLTFNTEFSPERAPKRPLPPGEIDWAPTISFLVRAHCDRDPWLNPTAICRRTGDNVPEDVRAKWPALFTEPFPHSRNAIPSAERERLRAHSHPFIRGTLLLGRFRTKDELNRMSDEDKRNTLITELANRSNQPVGHYQGLNDVDLAGTGAVLVFLREAGIRDDATLRTMSDDDMRNTLIVETEIHTRVPDVELQAMDNILLVEAGLSDIRR